MSAPRVRNSRARSSPSASVTIEPSSWALPRRGGRVGFGGALDDRGGLRPGGGKRARDDVENEAHPETTAQFLEAMDGTAAQLERGGPVVYEKRDPGRPDEVEGALIAELGAQLAALAEAGTGLAGVGASDGQAHGEQAGRD